MALEVEYDVNDFFYSWDSPLLRSFTVSPLGFLPTRPGQQ